MRDVSVVIPHHGDPGPTLALIEQLRPQHDGEIVVVDDASPNPFPDVDGVTVVRRAENGGFGSAVNSGAAVATGDGLLVLNSDLHVTSTFVADMVAAAERFPDTVLSPRVVDRAGRPDWVGRDFPRVHHQVVEWLTPLARWRDTDTWHRGVGHDVRTQGGHTSVDWVMGAAMLIPTAPFRAVGGFDERFFMNSEEIDLQRRLRERGIPSVALGAPSVVHVGGGSSPSPTRRQWLVDSRLAYADKWGARRRLQVSLAAATAVNLVVNAGRRAAGRDVHPVRVARGELSMLRRKR